MHLSFHPPRFYAPVLHIHYGFLPHKIPQPAIPVRLRSIEALRFTDIYQAFLV